MENISNEEYMSGHMFETMDRQRRQGDKQEKLRKRVRNLEREVADLKDRLQSALDINSLWDGR